MAVAVAVGAGVGVSVGAAFVGGSGPGCTGAPLANCCLATLLRFASRQISRPHVLTRDPTPTPKPMASHGTGERHWAVHPVHLVKVFVEVYSRSGTVFLKTCSQSTSTSSTAS
mmetsp:Transcript_18828/g.60156  ORF Transcript_18828/g.60156 Transcript_18828/m.60156 type:complete len:113 (+) Transcript_18828:1-339(+)